jgi:hypothetical protein
MPRRQHPPATRDPRADPPIETEYRPRRPIDAHRAIALQQRGAHDPAQLSTPA